MKNRNKIGRSRIFKRNWFLTLQNLRLLEFMTKYFVLSFCALWSTLLTSVTNHLTKMFGNWETEWTWKGVHLKSLHPNTDDFLQKLGTGGAMNCLSWKKSLQFSEKLTSFLRSILFVQYHFWYHKNWEKEML